MINPMLAHHNNRGFTLLETIIYVGLLGIMFSGIFVSIYPFFTGAERLTRNIAAEGETAFILNKIRYALAEGITEPTDTVALPTAGNSSDTLVIEDGDAVFTFEQNPDSACVPPATCHPTLDLTIGDGDPLPLNADRVPIENFSVRHYAPTGGAPRYLEITFDANGESVGPVVYYLHDLI
jgi:type II secretory pathway pseudopilin PulG